MRVLSYRRKFLCALAGLAALAFLTVPGAICAQQPDAHALASGAKDLTGTWQGTLHAGKDLRVVTKITKADSGGYKAVFYSIDQGGQPLPVDTITLDGSSVKMALKMIGGTYDGKLSGDGNTIDGSWSQGPNPLPLVLTRATPETEWTIPPPAPVIPPMAADANPSLAVATIKPSNPTQRGKGFGFRGTHFVTMNTNLNDLIAFAYGLHSKQIMGAPAWFGTELFDIDGVPDATGRPNLKQMGVMVQKLLADRFQLKFHHEQRELSVYAVRVAGGWTEDDEEHGGSQRSAGIWLSRSWRSHCQEYEYG